MIRIGLNEFFFLTVTHSNLFWNFTLLYKEAVKMNVYNLWRIYDGF